MGSAIVVFHEAGNRSREREPMPVTRLPGARTEIIATSATSARTTLVGVSQAGSTKNTDDGGFVTVFAVGANLWVTAGAGSPVAVKPATGANGTGYPILAGQKETFAIAADHKIAAIEWT